MQEYWQLRRIFPLKDSQFMWLKESGTPKVPSYPVPRSIAGLPCLRPL